MWIVLKIFTKLVVCSHILKARISKCHLEVVVLCLIICLECEEMTHAEGRNKRGNEKGWVCSRFFPLDVVYELGHVKMWHMQCQLWRTDYYSHRSISRLILGLYCYTWTWDGETSRSGSFSSDFELLSWSCQLGSTSGGWGSTLCECTEFLQSPHDVSRL